MDARYNSGSMEDESFTGGSPTCGFFYTASVSGSASPELVEFIDGLESPQKQLIPWFVFAPTNAPPAHKTAAIRF